MPWFWNADLDVLLNQLDRIERKITTLTTLVVKTKETAMATQVELDALNNAVTANTDAVNSAAAALAGYVQTVERLTDQLQEALNNNDSAAVQAATAALAANNSALMAAIPATAQAIIANTPASED